MNRGAFKEKLEAEKVRLTRELGTIGHEKGKQNGSWEAKGTIKDHSIDADSNEVADKIEEFETNQAIVESLKSELREVNDALARIDSNTYGFCQVCGKKIEEDRLHANLSARTCIEHMNSVV
jgi:RNA polymerase-binding transcription factor DksA